MKNGSWWPRGIIAFFIALAAFESWFVYVAITKHPSTIFEKRPYEAGLAYGKVVDATRAAQAAGISFEVDLFAEGIRGALHGVDLSPGWEVDVSVIRFDDPSLDQARQLSVTENPFSVSLAPLKPGLYLVRLWAKRGETTYFFERYAQRR